MSSPYRSTTLDSWQLVQLRNMKVGGNASATEFFARHGGQAMLSDADTKKKYSSRAAELYREELAKRVKEDAVRCVSRLLRTCLIPFVTSSLTSSEALLFSYFIAIPSPSVSFRPLPLLLWLHLNSQMLIIHNQVPERNLRRGHVRVLAILSRRLSLPATEQIIPGIDFTV